MSSRISSRLSLLIVISIVTSVLAGIFLPSLMAPIAVFGSLFVSTLKLLLLPLILSSVVVGVVGLGNMTKLGRSLMSTFTYFVITTVAAVAIGLLLVTILQPGVGVDATGFGLPAWAKSAAQVRFDHILGGLIPQNPIGALIDGNFLGLILFALLLGVVLSQMGKKGKPVADFFSSLLEGTLGVLKYFLYAAPLGLFALIGPSIATQDGNLGEMFASLGMFSLTTFIGMILLFAVMLPLALKFWGNRSPITFLSNLHPALLIAFGTGSSAVAYPVAYSNVTEDDSVDARASSLVLSLGHLINLQGTALYLTIATVFVAQVSNISLSLVDLITIGAVAAIVSMGSVSLPNVSLFGLAVIMSIVGFPPSSFAVIALLLIVDWFFDRCRAVVNIWGDAVGAAIISETFEFKTARGGRTVTERPRTTARSSSSAGRRDVRPGRNARTGTGRSSTDTRSPRKTSSTRSTPTKSRTGAISAGSPSRRETGPSRPGTARKTDTNKRPERSDQVESSQRQDSPVKTERSSRGRRSTTESKPVSRERRTTVRRPAREASDLKTEPALKSSLEIEVETTVDPKVPVRSMPPVPPLPKMPDSAPALFDTTEETNTPDTKVERTESATSEPIDDSASRRSLGDIESERARIVSELTALQQINNKDVDTSPETPVADVVDEAVDQTEFDNTSDIDPDISHERVRDTQGEPEQDSVAESASQSVQLEITESVTDKNEVEDEASKSQSFGRTRTRRGPKRSTSTDNTDTQETTSEEPVSETPVEAETEPEPAQAEPEEKTISFGRPSRRRTRR